MVWNEDYTEGGIVQQVFWVLRYGAVRTSDRKSNCLNAKCAKFKDKFRKVERRRSQASCLRLRRVRSGRERWELGVGSGACVWPEL